MCRNWKLWIGVGVVALTLGVAAPNLRPALPYLLVAACPISMLAMAASMTTGSRRKQAQPSASDDTSNQDEIARLRAEIADLRDRATR
jgi:hypothetical protein